MIFYVNLFDIFQNAGSISIYIIRKIKSTLIVPNHFRKLSIKKNGKVLSLPFLSII